MDECATDLELALADIVRLTSADQRIGMVVFLTLPGFAFDEFPLAVSAWTADGREVDSELWEYQFLPGRTLLPPEESYPLGRADWLGFNTMKDVGLIDRILTDRLRLGWLRVSEGVEAPNALVDLGHDDNSLVGQRDLVDLVTGEARAVEFDDSLAAKGL